MINNRLDWHLLYNSFNGIFLPAIKVIDYCNTPSMPHLHIFYLLCWLPNKSSIAGMFCYELIFLFVMIFLPSTFLLNILLYMSS